MQKRDESMPMPTLSEILIDIIQVILSSELDQIHCDYCNLRINHDDKFVIMANPDEHRFSIYHTDCFIKHVNKETKQRQNGI